MLSKVTMASALLKRLMMEDSLTFLRRVVLPRSCMPCKGPKVFALKTVKSTYCTSLGNISPPVLSSSLGSSRHFSQGDHALRRTFSSRSMDEAEADTTMMRFARYMVICMMIAVGVKVVPSLGTFLLASLSVSYNCAV